MKFAARLDLAPLREAAYARIDALWSELHVQAEPLARLRAAKETAATRALKGAAVHPALVSEAKQRDVEPLALCKSISAAAEADRNDVLRHEPARQAAKTAVRAATDQIAIDAAVADFATQIRRG